jgi:hypothetical protein
MRIWWKKEENNVKRGQQMVILFDIHTISNYLFCTVDGEEHQNENVEGPSLAPLNGKPKLNSAGSVKLQAQEPAGLRELTTEGKSTTN